MKTSYLCFALGSLLVGCGGAMGPGALGEPGAAGDGATAHQLPDLGPGAVDDAAPPVDDLAPPADDLAPPLDMAKPTPPVKKTLPFVWQGESVYYFCGPSATRMALSTRLKTLPSQQELANYMGTDENGTDDIGLVRGALDHYFNINAYRETDIPNDTPTAAQQQDLKAALVASIDAGYGLVANVVSGWRPPGYPGGTIYHYVALIGYDQNGDKVLIADPAATGCGDGACGSPSSGFYNVPKSYWIDTSDLGVWITPKGYTWHP